MGYESGNLGGEIQERRRPSAVPAAPLNPPAPSPSFESPGNRPWLGSEEKTIPVLLSGGQVTYARAHTLLPVPVSQLSGRRSRRGGPRAAETQHNEAPCQRRSAGCAQNLHPSRSTGEGRQPHVTALAKR